MNNRDTEILIVEDDEAIATGLALNLRLEGFRCRMAFDGVDASEKIAEQSPDLLLLDIAMPRKDGIELLRELRSAGSALPIIVLSARDGEYDKVAALRIGADDYVTKPFTLAELVARVDAVLRRSKGFTATSSAPSQFGDVTVDCKTRTVSREGAKIKLTHLEFELLSFFISHPNQVFTREELLREVWSQKGEGSRRTVDNFLAKLRAKLEGDPEAPKYFVTVRGSGYRFVPDPD